MLYDFSVNDGAADYETQGYCLVSENCNGTRPSIRCGRARTAHAPPVHRRAALSRTAPARRTRAHAVLAPGARTHIAAGRRAQVWCVFGKETWASTVEGINDGRAVVAAPGGTLQSISFSGWNLLVMKL